MPILQRDPAAANAACYRQEEAVRQYAGAHLFRAERRLFTKYCAPGALVLDLACGSGRTTVHLRSLGCRVIGVDLSDVLVAAGKASRPELNLCVGSYCDIPVKSGVADLVLISFNGLDYAYPEEQRVRALRECARTLRPGGRLIFSSHNLKSLHASPYMFRSLERARWRFRNALAAFADRRYLWDLGPLYSFYASPAYIVRQTSAVGFRFLERCGVLASRGRLFNRVVAPYIHYVFEKR